MTFSTSTPSTSSYSRPSRSRMAITSRSTAVPGAGCRRMRWGEMLPKCSSRSATVQSAGKEGLARPILDSSSLTTGKQRPPRWPSLDRRGGLAGEGDRGGRALAAVDQGVQVGGPDRVRQGEQLAVGEAAAAAGGDV